MTDWQEKVVKLEEDNLSIRLEKNGQILFESKDPMLKPLFMCLENYKQEMNGATVIDKIVGKAAAYLCILGNVKEIFTPLASESARKVLQPYGIKLKAMKEIPYIANRDNTGMCPMEKMANEAKTPQDFYEKLKQIIK